MMHASPWSGQGSGCIKEGKGCLGRAIDPNPIANTEGPI